jgi:hypothetical protein
MSFAQHVIKTCATSVEHIAIYKVKATFDPAWAAIKTMSIIAIYPAMDSCFGVSTGYVVCLVYYYTLSFVSFKCYANLNFIFVAARLVGRVPIEPNMMVLTMMMMEK